MKMNEFSNGKVHIGLPLPVSFFLGAKLQYKSINVLSMSFHLYLLPSCSSQRLFPSLLFIPHFFSSLLPSFPPSFAVHFLFLPFPPSFPHFPSFLPSFLPPTPTPTPSSPHSIPTHLPESRVGTYLTLAVEVRWFLASRNRIRRSISIAEIFVITPIRTRHNFINSSHSIHVLFVHQCIRVLLLL